MCHMEHARERFFFKGSSVGLSSSRAPPCGCDFNHGCVIHRIELNWIELNWIELSWVELSWIKLNWRHLYLNLPITGDRCLQQKGTTNRPLLRIDAHPIPLLSMLTLVLNGVHGLRKKVPSLLILKHEAMRSTLTWRGRGEMLFHLRSIRWYLFSQKPEST